MEVRHRRSGGGTPPFPLTTSGCCDGGAEAEAPDTGGSLVSIAGPEARAAATGNDDAADALSAARRVKVSPLASPKSVKILASRSSPAGKATGLGGNPTSSSAEDGGTPVLAWSRSRKSLTLRVGERPLEGQER